MTNRPEVTEHREDISRYMVHLTRDDTDQNGGPARDNFLGILASETIAAYRPHCLHAGQLPDVHRKKFNVACFTECPLSQIRHMVGWMPGRKIQLEPFGFVFKREFLMERNAQPVTYINTYGDDKGVREAYDAIFETALKMKFTGSKWKVLPFLARCTSDTTSAGNANGGIGVHYCLKSVTSCVLLFPTTLTSKSRRSWPTSLYRCTRQDGTWSG